MHASLTVKKINGLMSFLSPVSNTYVWHHSSFLGIGSKITTFLVLPVRDHNTYRTTQNVKIIEALSDRFAMRRCTNCTTQAGVYTVQVEQLKATKELIKTAGIRNGFVSFQHTYMVSVIS